MESIFKEGDEVFDIGVGWGSVVNIVKGEIFPVKVLFKTGERDCYTQQGRVLPNQAQRFLSFTEYTIEGFSQNRPCKFKKDEAVLVRDSSNHQWVLRYHTGESNICFDDGKNSTDRVLTSYWEQIKPLSEFQK